LFQRTILALAAGVWLGTTFLSGFNPLLGLWLFLREYVVQQALLDSFRLELLGFVIGLVALIGIISRGGGVQGMLEVITKLVHSAKSSQMATYLMGLTIFFDDYANTILVGNSMRPLTDRFRVSREKLAYIVDSTAAPVAGISILSTWVAYEVSLFAPQLLEVGIIENPYLVFAQTIPYRFYAIFTLLFILIGILSGREFGPMLAAEKRARSLGHLSHPDARPMVSDTMTRVQPKENIPHRWWNGVLPLVTVIVVTLCMMWQSGNASLDAPYPLSAVLSLTALRDIIANANSTQAIAGGAWSGFALAAFLMLTQRNLTTTEVLGASFSSTRALSFAIVILILAWCIGGVCRDMGTAYYLVALFKQSLSPNLYPIVLFLVSCLVSFSTGSSWSTMAIILPNAVLLAHLLGADSVIGPYGLTIVSIGAVLEGSIFGDHCSPLSDTTILSSVSSASDHIHHVRTQIPYAVTTMLVAILAGYLPATRGVSPWICIACGVTALFLVLRFAGKNPEREVEADQRT
ncbi:MAG: Na+/H+ antiporter NhaC family protein, partial [Gemmatimonadetes bacterium]|nr:Na+/H+ antiporter NhaC family protein [Gemmatimonadota bacterium]